MSTKIYELKRSDEAWGRIDFVKHQEGAIHIPFEGDDYFANKMIMFKEFTLPESISFASDFKIIPEIDYPHNDFDENLMSLKMIDVFLGLEKLVTNQIPVFMYNHKEMEAYHIEEGLLLEELKEVESKYAILQLLNPVEAFDYKNSTFKESVLKGKLRIRNLVLKTPTSGFPPIFKIEEKATSTFVTEEAKNALEAADIKGCIFEEVEVSS